MVMVIIKTRIKREEKRTIYTIILILSGIGSVYHVNKTCMNICPKSHMQTARTYNENQQQTCLLF